MTQGPSAAATSPTSASNAYVRTPPGTEPLELANPLSEAYSVLRRSLVPNLVESARFNQRRGVPAVRLFEIGRAFFPVDKLGALPDQPQAVAPVEAASAPAAEAVPAPAAEAVPAPAAEAAPAAAEEFEPAAQPQTSVVKRTPASGR